MTVLGGDTTWTQEFVDGDEPFFNPIEEGVAAGRYGFRIDYIHNDTGQQKMQRKKASEDRRALLKKRLELLQKGDREGAAAALKQANRIRSKQSEKSRASLAESRKQRKSDFITHVGKFTVLDNGKVEPFDEMKEMEKQREQSSKQKEESPQKISDL